MSTAHNPEPVNGPPTTNRGDPTGREPETASLQVRAAPPQRDRSSETENTVAALAIGGLLLLLAFAVYWQWAKFTFGASEVTAGTFGDAFGFVNAYLTGITMVGLIFTIVMQRQQLALQRAELEATRHEVYEARMIAEHQAAALREQVTLQRQMALEQRNAMDKQLQAMHSQILYSVNPLLLPEIQIKLRGSLGRYDLEGKVVLNNLCTEAAVTVFGWAALIGTQNAVLFGPKALRSYVLRRGHELHPLNDEVSLLPVDWSADAMGPHWIVARFVYRNSLGGYYSTWWVGKCSILSPEPVRNAFQHGGESVSAQIYVSDEPWGYQPTQSDWDEFQMEAFKRTHDDILTKSSRFLATFRP